VGAVELLLEVGLGALLNELAEVVLLFVDLAHLVVQVTLAFAETLEFVRAHLRSPLLLLFVFFHQLCSFLSLLHSDLVSIENLDLRHGRNNSEPVVWLLSQRISKQI